MKIGIRYLEPRNLNLINLSLIIMGGLLLIMSLSNQQSFAIAPEVGGYTEDDGGVFGGPFATFPVVITVNDIDASGYGSVKVRITSSQDPVGFDLTLNEGPLGTFKNTNLALMRENALATASSSMTMTIEDDSNPNPLIQELDPSRFIIISDSDTVGLTPIFTESGNNTNLFTATINFGTSTNSSSNTLKVSEGDIFSIYDEDTKVRTNGFIIPNPNVGQGAILGKVDDTVTATYQGDSSSFVIGPGESGGTGSGGPAKIGLVFDSSSGSNDNSGNGGGCKNCQPPTLGLDSNYNRVVHNGFSFNGNPVDVKKSYTPYPLIKANVGEENKIVLKIFDDGGIENISHIGLAFGLGKDETFSESKATINWDKTFDGKEVISTLDPENVLDDVRIQTSVNSCSKSSDTQCLIVTIYQKFRDTLEFNIVATNVWDSKRNAWQNTFNHGIEIVGESLNPPKTKMVAFGEKNMRGQYELVQIDKKQHLWSDDFGNIYLNKGNDRFDRVYFVPDSKDLDNPTFHGCNRTCNWFEDYKLQQALLAEDVLSEILDGKKIQNDKESESFSYTFNILQRSENKELQQSIITEQVRAEQKLQGILFPSK